MGEVSTIGVDIAKSVFQIHGVETGQNSIPLAPIKPPTPNRITVAGTNNDTNANDSQNESTKTIAAAHSLWLCTNKMLDWAKSFMRYRRHPLDVVRSCISGTEDPSGGYASRPTMPGARSSAPAWKSSLRAYWSRPTVH